MKILIACVIILNISFAQAQHEHHPKHNMVMFGEKEIFISHIVYKTPHNYQVILKVRLDQVALNEYLIARQKKPGDLIILFLDHMDISKIAEAELITGTIFSEDKEGIRKEIIRDVKINRKNFKIIFFDEVPLNLGGITISPI